MQSIDRVSSPRGDRLKHFTSALFPSFESTSAHATIRGREALLANAAMIAATRRWFRRNRTNLLVGAGVIGAGYVAGQYVLGRFREARQRTSEERVSKEKYVI